MNCHTYKQCRINYGYDIASNDKYTDSEYSEHDDMDESVSDMDVE